MDGGNGSGVGPNLPGHRPPRLLRAVFCLRNSTQTNSTSQLLKVRSSLLLFFVKRSSWGRLIASIVPPPHLTPHTSIRPTTTTAHTQRQHACALPRHFYPPSSITSIRRNFFERVFGSVTSTPGAPISVNLPLKNRRRNAARRTEPRRGCAQL